MKKLVLNKETVRVLQDSDLRQVAGGAPDNLAVAVQTEPVVTFSGCVTWSCPCGSSITDTTPTTPVYRAVEPAAPMPLA
ncbi:MAG: class I lanthipeptide [Phycisphaerae bacterium]|nr:class I lanthipeptide [Phycisphaerae bacterium]